MKYKNISKINILRLICRSTVYETVFRRRTTEKKYRIKGVAKVLKRDYIFPYWRDYMPVSKINYKIIQSDAGMKDIFGEIVLPLNFHF